MICTPKQKRGADKFGIEHEVEAGKENKPITGEEVTDYMDTPYRYSGGLVPARQTTGPRQAD